MPCASVPEGIVEMADPIPLALLPFVTLPSRSSLRIGAPSVLAHGKAFGWNIRHWIPCGINTRKHQCFSVVGPETVLARSTYRPVLLHRTSLWLHTACAKPQPHLLSMMMMVVMMVVMMVMMESIPSDNETPSS